MVQTVVNLTRKSSENGALVLESTLCVIASDSQSSSVTCTNGNDLGIIPLSPLLFYVSIISYSNSYIPAHPIHNIISNEVKNRFLLDKNEFAYNICKLCN